VRNPGITYAHIISWNDTDSYKKEGEAQAKKRAEGSIQYGLMAGTSN
jgi:hypothetical protein